jgi:hypothetical protein
VSITTPATSPPLPTPIVTLKLFKCGTNEGTEVQCPVQYSSSNPPCWFLRASARLPFGTSVTRMGGTYRYMYKVNGYPPPGHSPGIWYGSGVSFVPPTRSTYTFEVFAQAFYNEQATTRVGSSGIISCKVQ